jgi:hypothetical protein
MQRSQPRLNALAKGVAMNRLLVLTAFLLPGCVTPNLCPYTPAVGFVSEQMVPNPDGSVRAFRIDFEERERAAPKTRYTLTPIVLDERGTIPEQRYLPSAWISESEVRSDFAVKVRVYRPGYLTIEIRPGESSRKWEWLPADFRDQERAIDVLLGLSDAHPELGWGPRGPRSEWPDSPGRIYIMQLGDFGLQPGSVAQAHRDVLLFAAGEYDRLAKSSDAKAPGMEKTRRRLENKANQIKQYANELTIQEFFRQVLEPTSR